MAMRTLQLPDDFRALEALISDLRGDPDWGMSREDVDDLLGMFTFLRNLWGPLGILRFINKGLNETLLGYVYEIERETVGAIIYDRMLGTDAWQLALLAVHPTFRGRGIATRLVAMAVQDISARGGTTIRLEVGGDSISARQLFERLGFETYNGFVEYDYALTTPPAPAALPEEYSVFPLSYYATDPRYELAKRITPPRLQLYEPVRKQDFQRNQVWWGLRRISLFVQGVRESEIVVRTMIDGQAVARGGIALRTGWGDISEIALRVDPDHAAIVPYLFHRLVADV